ncbi:MAG TPA: DUF3800 domain-containing protein [Candidatus Paceibacterota bacterium]|jgi:hypothetical protein|nr:DUF3800 domain-containing protein [Candidatus Paceibacterota bacterium]
MPISGNTVRIFIDESGTPDAYVSGKHQEHDKYFTIAAVVIHQKAYEVFKSRMNAICETYSPYLLNKEIKSNYIRLSNPRTLKEGQTPPYIFYQFPEAQELYDVFCSHIKTLIKETEFEIISVTTNKEHAGQKHPAHSIQQTLLGDLWERIAIFYVINKRPNIKILFDRTKSHYDLILKKSFESFKRFGTWYFPEEVVSQLRLDKDVYSCDSEDSRGIQLVDLCAYPIKKQHEKGNHDFYAKVIKGKLHTPVTDKRSKKTINMGTKRSLN